MGWLEHDLAEIRSIQARQKVINDLHQALRAMVDRWEPDCGGQDRVMWENACEALESAQPFLHR